MTTSNIVVSNEKLKRNLGLFDVYAVSTGAMFSSGFFLLPGVAMAETGPSVVLAYLVSSFIIAPAMFSMAELTTAMPRAGGDYYCIDRSLGPLAGTIGGLGTWLALVLKSSFALVGMGAYIAIFVDIPIRPVAAVLTVVFAVLNVIGAKESTRLQRILVGSLVGIMTFYCVQGVFAVINLGFGSVMADRFTPFTTAGLGGFFATVGLVFVSYAGLTKVASIAEEVRNPDRNIPLGMILALITTMLIYVIGVFVMVALLPQGDLQNSLTPVSDAGDVFLSWLAQPIGLVLVTIAAVAAFASTANAGILSASRYPLAMSRDHLIPVQFSKTGRYGTPTFAIVVTSSIMLFAVIFLDVASIAKLASAFQLMIFALLSLSVIVMRESRISSYVPGFESPLYPWMQIFGIIAAVLLIFEIGQASTLFTVALVISGIAWYYAYARKNVEREGAIYHIYARLGKRRFEGLDHELRDILKERELEEGDPYERIVSQAHVLDFDDINSYEEVVKQVASLLSSDLPYSTDDLSEKFLQGQHIGSTAVSHGAALPELRLAGIKQSRIILVRVRSGIKLNFADLAVYEGERIAAKQTIHAVIFLLSPQERTGQHLRILAELVSRVDEAGFLREWHDAADEHALREVFLRHERFVQIYLDHEPALSTFAGKHPSDIHLPKGTLLALIQRDGETLVPQDDTLLEAGDCLTIIGDPRHVNELYESFH